MSALQVTFEASATTLVAGEDPLCGLTITNHGPAAAEVPNLDLHQDWPLFELRDLDRDTVQGLRPAVLRGELNIKAIPFRAGDGPMVVLAPGESRTWRFNLSHQVRLLRPGRSQVQVLLPPGGAPTASPPVLITVVPAEVSRSDLTHADGGYSDLFFETWGDRRTGALYLRALRMRTRLAQLQCMRIGRSRSPVEPILSIAPNRGTSATRCVSWLEGNTFHAIDIGLEGVVRPKRTLLLPWPVRSIVPHPSKDPESETTEAWVGVDAHLGLALVPLTIRADGIDAGEPVLLPDGQFLWGRSYFRSDGERLALLLSPGERGLQLSHVGQGPRGGHTVQPLADWPWTFLAIAACLDGDDTIHGVVLGHPVGEDELRAASYCSWSLDRAGRLHVAPTSPWPGLTPASLDHLTLAIDGKGLPHALVQDGDGTWSCLTPESSFEVRPPNQTGQALDGPPLLRFFARGKVPVVFWHDANRGVLGVPIGMESPSFSGPDFEQPPTAD